MATWCLCIAAFGWSAMDVMAQESQGDDGSVEALKTLYEARDYFALYDQLVSRTGEPTPQIRFYQAASLTAFNQPEDSNRLLDQIEHDPSLNEAQRQQIHLLRYRNFLRMHEFAAARKAGVLAHREGRGKPGVVFLPSVRNQLKLLHVLEDTLPQEVTIHATTKLSPVNGRILGRVGDVVQSFRLDINAPFCVISQKVALTFGLKIHEVGMAIHTSTSRVVKADVAMAKQFNLGDIEFRHVVFLVFPDDLLEVDQARTFEGLLGFPILEALGEVRFLNNGDWEIPAHPPSREPRSLAFDDLDLITRIRFGDEESLARINLGARVTTGFRSFYDRFQTRLEAEGNRFEKKIGLAETDRLVPALRLPTFAFTLDGHDVNLKYVDVFQESILPTSANKPMYLDIGQDALKQFDRVILNFRDMAIVVE
ncbi:MAG: retropepsin-like aspartic protease [Planctomycetota bacterium]|nr:retropepsin-like aspartic protease [Planctomycetota bacterium]